MPLDATQFGLVPLDTGTPTPGATASYPMVAAHPAPDNSGAQTNMSDEDYGKFMRGEQPPTVTVTAKAPKSPPLDAASFGLVPADSGEAAATGAPAAETTEPQKSTNGPAAPEQEQPSFLHQLAGSMAATLDALPRGVTGNAVDYVNAALQTPFRMFTGKNDNGSVTVGMQGPGAAFNEGLQHARDVHNQLSTQYPISSLGGEMLSGGMLGYAAAPALGYQALTAGGPMLSRAASIADYLGRNAAFGGMTSAMTGGDPTTGAALGGGIASGVPLAAKVGSLAMAPYRKLAPLWSDAARQQSVQNALQRNLAGAPIVTSPVGPLDLAQATNSPQIAAKVRYAQGIPEGQAPAKALQTAQTKAAQTQVAQIGAPSSAADASEQGAAAIRRLEELSDARARELWNAPALTDVLLSPKRLAAGVQARLNAVGKDDPGLLLGMTPHIRKAIDGLAKLPDRANLRNINSYISVLKAVLRNPPENNPRAAALARELLDAAMKGLDDTISSSGVSSSVQEAYQAARDFTRQQKTILGTPDMARVLGTNSAGAFKSDASEALGKFFNFANGSGEGPQNIQQLIEFADQIKGAVLGRGDKAVALGMARDQLRDASRSYVAAALVKAARLGEGQNFNPKTVQDFLRQNTGWMIRSGLFQRPQIQAVERLSEYVDLLRRTEGLNPQGGAATNQRGEVAKTFIDQIMSKWTRRLLELAAPVIGHEAHGGGLGAVAGLMVGGVAEKAFTGAENAMRELMSETLFDSQVAKDLMMRPTRGNEAFLSPKTREIIARLRLAIGSDVVPHFAARRSEVPATVQVAH